MMTKLIRTMKGPIGHCSRETANLSGTMQVRSDIYALVPLLVLLPSTPFLAPKQLGLHALGVDRSVKVLGALYSTYFRMF